MGDKNIKCRAKKFSRDYQPSKESIKKRAAKLMETCRKRRELSELLGLALKGSVAPDLNELLKNTLGVKAHTLEEAIHFRQILNALTAKDTSSYNALMQVSGLAKPMKVDTTTKGESLNSKAAIDYSKLSTMELLTLKKLTEKCVI